MNTGRAAGASAPSGARIVPVGALRSVAVTTDLAVPGRALAVGAHPDDIEFGCGATLARWARHGCRLHLVVLTDGSKGTWDADADQRALVVQRMAEQRMAAAVLGGGPVDVTFLGAVDGELRSDTVEGAEALRRALCDVIRRHRPDVVLGHDPWRRYRLHPDHRHAGWLVTDAVVAARDPGFFPELGVAAHRPDELLLWEADEPNHVEEVDHVDADTLATAAHGELAPDAPAAVLKLGALLAHRSQWRSTMGIEVDGPHADEQRRAFAARLVARLAEHGGIAGLPAGEAFHRIADL